MFKLYCAGCGALLDIIEAEEKYPESCVLCKPEDFGIKRKQMTQHTALPWVISSSLIICDQNARMITSAVACDLPELYIDYKERRANTSFIVRAVNSHEKLIEALERLTRVASVELKGRRDDVLEQAREALKLAGKE